MDKLILMRFTAPSLPVLVHINGVCIGSVPANQSMRFSIHEFLRNGDNHFTIESLQPAEQLVAKSRALKNCELRLELHKIRAGAWAEPVVLAGSSPALNEPFRLTAQGRLMVLAFTYSLPIKFPVWRFLDLAYRDESTAVVTRTNVDTFNATVKLHELFNLVMEGEIQQLDQRCMTAVTEKAIAYGRSLLDAERAQRAFWRSIASSALPFDPAQVLGPPLWVNGLCLMHESRVLTPLALDGKPWLRFPSESSNWTYWPLGLASLGNEYVVVR